MKAGEQILMNKFEVERELMAVGFSHIAGTDEAGAGSLVGPVVAAAVILHKDRIDERIDDSKKLNVKLREELFEVIKRDSLAWAVGINSVSRINEINILWARMEAMKIAAHALKVAPDYVLVDGNTKVPDLDIPQKTIIKGDAKSYSIAAASIIAKVTRDRMMIELGEYYPDYNLASNKGYWNLKMKAQIEKDGYIKGFHRRAFVKNILGEVK